MGLLRENNLVAKLNSSNNLPLVSGNSAFIFLPIVSTPSRQVISDYRAMKLAQAEIDKSDDEGLARLSSTLDHRIVYTGNEGRVVVAATDKTPQELLDRIAEYEMRINRIYRSVRTQPMAFH